MERGKTPAQSKIVTPVAFLQECDRGMVETLCLYGRHFTSVLDVEKCVAVYGLCEIGDVVSFIKNFLSFWIPFSIGDDLPPGMPEPPYHVMTRHARSYFQNTFGSGGRFGKRIIRLAGIMTYSKRLFPSVPQSFVDEKLEKYSKSLQREDPVYFPFKNELMRAIEKEIDNLPSSMLADYTQPFAPSVSSCVENTKTDGGVQAYVRELFMNDAKTSQNSSWGQDEFGAFRTMSRIDILEKKLDKFSPSDISKFTNTTWDEIMSFMLTEAYYMHTANREGSGKREIACPVGLLEPLKVRIITRQSWNLNLLRPVQKAWHDAMRQLPTFELIGGVEPIESLRSLPNLKRGECWVSGDYEAATDNIYLWATKHALECLFKRTQFKFTEKCSWLTEEIQEFLKDLSIRSFCNLDVRIKGQDDIPVLRGQMMGNILSFPLLCLINAAATRLALGPTSQFRINGDDVACIATPKQYKRWKYVTQCVGLKFSLGKNYYSNKFWMINSQYFIWSKEEKRLVRVMVPNVGLLNSSSLLSVDDRTGREILPLESLTALWDRFEKTLHDDAMRARGLKLFTKRYKKHLENFPGSLYGPKEVGCLGVTPPAGFKYTRQQRIWMAAHLSGSFDYRQGRTTEYSRITSQCQKVTSRAMFRLNLNFAELTTPGPLARSYFDFRSQRKLVVPDPYSRGGGFENRLMPIVRWFTKPSSNSAAKVFIWRRWRRYLRSCKTHDVLPESVISQFHNWGTQRRGWVQGEYHP